MRSTLQKTACIAAAALITASLTACSQKLSEKSFFAMDTIINLTAYGEKAPEAISAAERKIKAIESELSVTDEQSDIYRANHSHGVSTEISADTAELLSFTFKTAKQTGGALDPTIYPVLLAWGFTTGENRVPEKEEIERLLQNTGCENVLLSGTTVTLPDGFMLDMGAVGKGFCGDKAAQIMSECGVTSALLDLGGNIQAVGTKPDGKPWRIALRDPQSGGNVGILELSDAAAVTSGAYERYFTDENGNTYGHIIDPSTGYPADNDLLQVTVVSQSGAYADALSTALFVMGFDGAEEFYLENGGFDLILITKDGSIYVTKGINGTFTPDAKHKSHLKVIEDEK